MNNDEDYFPRTRIILHTIYHFPENENSRERRDTSPM